jgi:hypothetical protein
VNLILKDLNNEEYKLEYTAVYQEFKDLFEAKMEGYINSLGKYFVSL